MISTSFPWRSSRQAAIELASSSEWVTTIRIAFCSLGTSRSSWPIFFAFSESRFPVGSSARSNVGLRSKARATATLSKSILQHVPLREQMVILEDKSDVLVAKFRLLVFS